MSDPTTSGEESSAPLAAAPTETPSATPAPAAASFGAGRGSGLARGKRSHVPAAAAPTAAPRGDYQPTAVQVIVAEREYQHPFGAPAPEPVPAAEPIVARVESVTSEPVSPVPAVAEAPVVAQVAPEVRPVAPAPCGGGGGEAHRGSCSPLRPGGKGAPYHPAASRDQASGHALGAGRRPS
jgi:hypothetical protein